MRNELREREISVVQETFYCITLKGKNETCHSKRSIWRGFGRLCGRGQELCEARLCLQFAS